ncbi:hypothetical protein AB0H12_35340 [Actinosynnema sp. NPDC023794]
MLVQACQNGTPSPDIRAEHEKIAWAAALVVHFPLWRPGMTAILNAAAPG